MLTFLGGTGRPSVETLSAPKARLTSWQNSADRRGRLVEGQHEPVHLVPGIISLVTMAAARKLQKSTLKPGGKFSLKEEKKVKVQKKKKEVYELQYEAGAIAPLYAWDPAGFVQKGPSQTESFYRLRQAELKHGRVAMLALVGEIVQHYVYLPFFEDVGKGLGALSISAGQFGFSLVVIFSGYLEVVVFNQDPKDKVRAGAFGDPWGVAKLLNLPDGADNLDMQNKELSNGRLAMMSIFVTFLLEKVTGQDAVEQLADAAKGLPFLS